MVYVIATGEKWLKWLSGALTGKRWSSWNPAATPTEDDVVIIVADPTVSRHLLNELLVLRDQLQSRVVVCAPFDRQHVHMVLQLAPDRAVWLDDGPAALSSAVDELGRCLPRLALVQRIVATHSFAETIIRAVRHSLLADHPPRTVNTLARRGGCTRSTLERRWRHEVYARTGLAPHHFVQWALIMHAHERRRQGHAWVNVAHQLNVDIKTLRAAGYATLKRTLRDIAELSASEIAEMLYGLFSREPSACGDRIDGATN